MNPLDSGKTPSFRLASFNTMSTIISRFSRVSSGQTSHRKSEPDGIFDPLFNPLPGAIQMVFHFRFPTGNRNSTMSASSVDHHNPDSIDTAHGGSAHGLLRYTALPEYCCSQHVHTSDRTAPAGSFVCGFRWDSEPLASYIVHTLQCRTRDNFAARHFEHATTSRHVGIRPVLLHKKVRSLDPVTSQQPSKRHPDVTPHRC